jgi:hypothetical protein
LAGQTLHEIPLPAELDQHFKGSAADLHRALAQYELRPGAAQSVLLRRSAMAGGGNATTARRR